MQPHWVGDLSLESIVEVKQVKPGGSSGWSWSRRGSRTDARSTSTTGTATFTRGEEELGRWRDVRSRARAATTSNSPTWTTA